MTRILLVFAALLALATLAPSAGFATAPSAHPERSAPKPLPRLAARATKKSASHPEAQQGGDRRCSGDGRHCIALATYVSDICRTIEATAREAALDPHFFARLLWKESLFDASAVSPKGAQGIAQFMPGTAELRGLHDPFNPAEALLASAHYLAELSAELGNIGLAAVAYNGGEARAARFVAREAGLADETRLYVQAITGFPAETWRDSPPNSFDLALAPGKPFRAACHEQAEGRRIREFLTEPVLLPWGVVVASNRKRSGAERHVHRLRHRLSTVLGPEPVAYVRERRPEVRGMMWFAQVGRNSRAEAHALCDRLRSAGGDCMVLKN